MTLSTPELQDSAEKDACRLARYLWLVPIATSLLSWGAVMLISRYVTCRCTVTEFFAIVVGALIGVSAAHALRERFCHDSKEKR
jgi:hypothetical protein